MSGINNQINALTTYAQVLKLDEQYRRGLLSVAEYERKAKEAVERFAEKFTPEPEAPLRDDEFASWDGDPGYF